MEGYHVIISKKMKLTDFCDELDSCDHTLEDLYTVEEQLSPIITVDVSNLSESDAIASTEYASQNSFAEAHGDETNGAESVMPLPSVRSEEIVDLSEDSGIKESISPIENLLVAEVDNVPAPSCSSKYTLSKKIQCANSTLVINDQRFGRQDSLDEEVYSNIIKQVRVIYKTSDFKFSDSEALHLTPFDEYISYLCPQCTVECGTLINWLQHTADEHQLHTVEGLRMERFFNGELESIRCKTCQRVFVKNTRISVLLCHRMGHLQCKYFLQCRLCRYIYKSKAGLIGHLRRKHSTFQETKERYPDGVMEHIRYLCPLCSEQQPTEDEWSTHLINAHGYFQKTGSLYRNNKRDCSIYICMKCDKRIYEHLLMKHMVCHKFQAVACIYCNAYTSYDLRSAIGHIRNRHLYIERCKRFTCEFDFCDAGFPTSEQRNMHYRAAHKVQLEKK